MMVFSTHEILQETQARLQKVQAERDALAAQVADYSKRIVHLENLRDSEESRLCLITDIVNATLNTNTKAAPIEAVTAIGDVLDADRSECLAEIRAEAVSEFANWAFDTCPNIDCMFDDKDDYIAKIRQGGAA